MVLVVGNDDIHVFNLVLVGLLPLPCRQGVNLKVLVLDKLVEVVNDLLDPLTAIELGLLCRIQALGPSPIPPWNMSWSWSPFRIS